MVSVSFSTPATLYAWDRSGAYDKNCYKNAFRLNRYNFRTVNAIDFLFSTLHNTPFLYVNRYFGVLHELCVDVMRPDYPWGSKLPLLQVGASNSFQILLNLITRLFHIGDSIIIMMLSSFTVKLTLVAEM